MSLILEAIKAEINKSPLISNLVAICSDGEIFSSINSAFCYYDFSPNRLTISANLKLSDISDFFIKTHIQEQYRELSISDFVIITQMEHTGTYTVRVIKNSQEQESFDFHEKELENENIINAKILSLAKDHNLNADRIFEYQEGDCGESATVHWGV